MRLTKASLDYLKSFEGLRLTAYQDIVGVWTIGYGCTDNVKPGQTLTLQEAEDMLRHEVREFEDGVTLYARVALNQNEFDALVIFSFNVGLGALQKSTLLRKLNAGDRAGAAAEFVRWNKAGGKEVAGLTRRRIAERDLFLKPVPVEQPKSEPKPEVKLNPDDFYTSD